MATVLFIDDHTCGSRILVGKLRAAGYEVCLALDAEEAIRLFRLYPVDAVVLDCGLCRMTGIDPVPVFRSLSPDVPMIMTSSCCGIACDRMVEANHGARCGGSQTECVGKSIIAMSLSGVWK